VGGSMRLCPLTYPQRRPGRARHGAWPTAMAAVRRQWHLSGNEAGAPHLEAERCPMRQGSMPGLHCSIAPAPSCLVPAMPTCPMICCTSFHLPPHRMVELRGSGQCRETLHWSTSTCRTCCSWPGRCCWASKPPLLWKTTPSDLGPQRRTTRPQPGFPWASCQVRISASLQATGCKERPCFAPVDGSRRQSEHS